MSNAARSMSLLEAYEAALQHDPTFRSAIHENEAGQQAEKLGLASLLPNLSMTHVQSKNAGYQNPNPLTGVNEFTSMNFEKELKSSKK